MPRDPEYRYNFMHIELDYLFDGKDYYKVIKPNGRSHCGTYKIGDDYWYDNDQCKQYVTNETKSLFEQARSEFIDKIEKAKNGQDGYICLVIGDYLLSYKQTSQERIYDFIVTSERYAEIFNTTTIYRFLCNGLSSISFHSQEEQLPDQIISALMSSALDNGDLYLAYAIKDDVKIITQEEADYLYSIDGKNRFVPEDKIYDTGDIEILDVSKCGGFYRTVHFSCIVKIKGQNYTAQWYPYGREYRRIFQLVRTVSNLNELFVWGNVLNDCPIRISDAIKSEIEKKIEELP